MTDKKEYEEIDCIDAIRLLHEYLDDELEAQDSEKVESHLNQCRACFSRSEFEKELNNKISKTGSDKAPKKVINKISKLIDKF